MLAIKDVLPAVLARLQSPELSNRSRLLQEWPTIAGPKLAGHTQPSLGRRGELYIWVDQSSLAFELNQRYRPALLKRVQAVLGEETVQSVHVRVGQLR